MRNIPAEPYLLGVVGGASAGAAVTIPFGVGAGVGGSELTGSAFAGALAAMVLVVLLGRAGGQVTSTRLLLAGVAVGYVFNALTSIMVFAAHRAEGAQDVMFWLLGSPGLADWQSVRICGLILLASTWPLATATASFSFTTGTWSRSETRTRFSPPEVLEPVYQVRVRRIEEPHCVQMIFSLGEPPAAASTPRAFPQRLRRSSRTD